jgi:hypothetical protein
MMKGIRYKIERGLLKKGYRKEWLGCKGFILKKKCLKIKNNFKRF